MTAEDINWEDPDAKCSQFFTVREVILLHKWDRLATEADGLTLNVKRDLVSFLSSVMDPLREYFGKPIRVHCCYRPKAYNLEIGGAKSSCHMVLEGSAAMDFDVDEDCDLTRKRLLLQLEGRGIRMEDLPGCNWVHVDNKPVPIGAHRYFKP